MSYTALLDANALYPAPIRDVLLELALTDIYRAKWSDDINHEWIEALLRNERHRVRANLERTRDRMNAAVLDCLVTGYQSLIPSLLLPDPDDRHVLAAAIVGRCDVIVTQNLKDFPDTALKPYGIEAQHPDDFLSNHLNLDKNVFCNVLRTVRTRLKKPPYTVADYFSDLVHVGLEKTVFALREHKDQL